MTVQQLNKRLDKLINAHVWSRTNDKVKLNVYQRICISQERAAIMELLDQIAPYSHISDFKVGSGRLKYQLPPHLNERVERINKIIENTGWTKPKHVAEPY